MKDIEEALHLAESEPALQPLYAEALRLKGLNLYPLGRSLVMPVEQLEHSLSLYTELKETGSIPMLLAETAMVHATVGDIESARIISGGVENMAGREESVFPGGYIE